MNHNLLNIKTSLKPTIIIKRHHIITSTSVNDERIEATRAAFAAANLKCKTAPFSTNGNRPPTLTIRMKIKNDLEAAITHSLHHPETQDEPARLQYASGANDTRRLLRMLQFSGRYPQG